MGLSGRRTEVTGVSSLCPALCGEPGSPGKKGQKMSTRLRIGERMNLFISSRCHELRRCREAAAAVAEDLGFRVVRSESIEVPFGASPLAICEKAAMDCHLYLLLIGREYVGPRPDPRLGGVSMTHREFRMAKAHDRDKVLVYVKRARKREPGANKFLCEAKDAIDGCWIQEFSDVSELERKVRDGILSWLQRRAEDASGQDPSGYAVTSLCIDVRITPTAWWRSTKTVKCRALGPEPCRLIRPRTDMVQGQFGEPRFARPKVIAPPHTRLKRNPFGIGSSAAHYDLHIEPPLPAGEYIEYIDKIAWRNDAILTQERLMEAPRRHQEDLLVRYSYTIPRGMQRFRQSRTFPIGYQIHDPILTIIRGRRRIPELEAALAGSFRVIGDGRHRSTRLVVDIEHPPVGCSVQVRYLPPRLAELPERLRKSMGLR